jgi:hypothetical protein
VVGAGVSTQSRSAFEQLAKAVTGNNNAVIAKSEADAAIHCPDTGSPRRSAARDDAVGRGRRINAITQIALVLDRHAAPRLAKTPWVEAGASTQSHSAFEQLAIAMTRNNNAVIARRRSRRGNPLP